MEENSISGTAYSIITEGLSQFNLEVYGLCINSFLSQDPLLLKSLISNRVSQKEKFKSQADYLSYLSRTTYILVPLVGQVLPNVLSRFKELGFTKSELMHILTFDEINLEIDKINANGVCLINDPAYFLHLKAYLSFKNENVFLNHVRPLVGNPDKTKIQFNSKRLFAINENQKKNRINRNIGMEKKSDNNYEDLWHELIENFDARVRIAYGLGFEESIQASTSRNIDYMLVDFFRKYCIPYSESISKSAQYREVYPLFAKLMPHRGWPHDEKEFKKTDIGGGLTYIQYMTKTMRKFIEKK